MTTQRPLRMLLVEDDSMIASVLAFGMEGLNVPYELDHAGTAEEGLELWDQQHYDVVLTDYNLRGMNGLSLLAALKQRGAAVPILLFTAYDTPALRREARAAGVTEYIAKPFLIDEFVHIVRGLLPITAHVVGADPQQ